MAKHGGKEKKGCGCYCRSCYSYLTPPEWGSLAIIFMILSICFLITANATHTWTVERHSPYQVPLKLPLYNASGSLTKTVLTNDTDGWKLGYWEACYHNNETLRAAIGNEVFGNSDHRCYHIKCMWQKCIMDPFITAVSGQYATCKWFQNGVKAGQGVGLVGIIFTAFGTILLILSQLSYTLMKDKVIRISGGLILLGTFVGPMIQFALWKKITNDDCKGFSLQQNPAEIKGNTRDHKFILGASYYVTIISFAMSLSIGLLVVIFPHILTGNRKQDAQCCTYLADRKKAEKQADEKLAKKAEKAKLMENQE